MIRPVVQAKRSVVLLMKCNGSSFIVPSTVTLWMRRLYSDAGVAMMPPSCMFLKVTPSIVELDRVPFHVIPW